jgi:hypothetical protein
MSKNKVLSITTSYIEKKSAEKKRNLSKKDRNISEFLVLKDQISETLDKGYSMKIVWEALHEEEKIISFGYDQFRRYVARHINELPEEPPFVAKPETLKPKSTGFTINPVPNKEDLY